VINWFQAFAFKRKLYRYAAVERAARGCHHPEEHVSVAPGEQLVGGGRLVAVGLALFTLFCSQSTI
jgi:hypothetical protein